MEFFEITGIVDLELNDNKEEYILNFRKVGDGVVVDKKWILKYKPVVGGYCVIHNIYTKDVYFEYRKTI